MPVLMLEGRTKGTFVNVKQKVDHRDHQKIDHLGIKLFTQMGG
jgi:hypothetical protein